ncbi:MAG: hypothetical protein A3F84_17320 [Candidatus Handelsmanbacteria bacterium RIFCSPLOWO2_12_FULL_64_10]|uniref:Uncharacterized protein n=1 Tax=Handelsmanbacteria sp. (strain RIFCSPLOWO2_12_FULL_64_10) TaxID=1817868 RepID=A0A1F6D795_HANXR|nr:MAG: hypothetical protein A3F84_17320 [Candidatus Handelsmanbacteria bacterium RIFCSPLOWO2_12_FULL_64_10]
MPDLEDRVSELERFVHGILAELGGLAIRLAYVRDELDETKERVSTQLNNMAQNALESRRRIGELETKIAAILSKLGG